MIDDFILGFGIAIFGGVIAVLGLPTVRRWRLPSLPVQPVNRFGLIVRRTATVVAVGTGVPIAVLGLAMAGAALVGMRIVFTF
jgi:hypothetical protein